MSKSKKLARWGAKEQLEYVEKMNSAKMCPYCKSDTVLKSRSALYPTDRGNDAVWVCTQYPACSSFVNCHRGTIKPYGRLANRELRDLRKQVHALFDPMWRNRTHFKTGYEAYRWLQLALGIHEFRYAHIGMLNEKQCQRLLEKLKGYLNGTVDSAGAWTAAHHQ